MLRFGLGIEDNRIKALARDNLQQLEDELCKLAGCTVHLLDVPSRRWHDDWAQSEAHVILQLGFESAGDVETFKGKLSEAEFAKGSGGGSNPCYGFGDDPAIHPMDVWSPISSGGGIFSDRDRADQLTGLSELGSDALGEGVNVVIADRGLDQDSVRETRRRMASRRKLSLGEEPVLKGWIKDPTALAGAARVRRLRPGETRSEHATMIARNVLAVAPRATLWDAPVLPREGDVDHPPGPCLVAQLFHWIRSEVRLGRMSAYDANGKAHQVPEAGPWVIVNAWGVYNPEQGGAQFQTYADDPDHFVVNDLPRTGENIDIVFAAGNCGEPCPDPRCGDNDKGLGCSIHGMNGHPDVLTVGQVRADGTPIAQSAQGPGRLGAPERSYASKRWRELAAKRRAGPDPEKVAQEWSLRAYEKPDLCGPSHFSEADDRSEFNTGTSAACGYVAGIVAALRSTKEGRDCPPEQLRKVLRDTAQREQDGWDPRLGYGIVHAGRARDKLRKGDYK